MHTSCISDDTRATCKQLNTQVTYVAPAATNKAAVAAEEGGFVKGVVTYMVMDDLVVKPMSTISSVVCLTSLMSARKKKGLSVQIKSILTD